MKFPIQVKSGRIMDLKRFNEYVTGLLDGDYQLHIDKKKDTRSEKQNRYYWGVLVELVSDAMGSIYPEEAHNYMQSLFLKDIFIYVDKKGLTRQVEIIKSTTGLKTDEFEEYQKKCREWASVELGCYIPLPNEVII